MPKTGESNARRRQRLDPKNKPDFEYSDSLLGTYISGQNRAMLEDRIYAGAKRGDKAVRMPLFDPPSTKQLAQEHNRKYRPGSQSFANGGPVTNKRSFRKKGCM